MRKRTTAPKKSSDPSKRLRALALKISAAVAVIVLVGAALIGALSHDNSASKFTACEHWRSTVEQACQNTKLDTQWTDAILAMMVIESGGDTNVRSVKGVEHDIMQAAEGKYGTIVTEGSSKYNVQAQTPEASIYAGVLEFKQNLKLWRSYLGGIAPDEAGKIELVVQGYNFGADGWYAWCKKNDYTVYTVERAQLYSDTVMPEDAKGTPTHADKWASAYATIRSETTK